MSTGHFMANGELGGREDSHADRMRRRGHRKPGPGLRLEPQPWWLRGRGFPRVLEKTSASMSEHCAGPSGEAAETRASRRGHLLLRFISWFLALRTFSGREHDMGQRGRRSA